MTNFNIPPLETRHDGDTLRHIALGTCIESDGFTALRAPDGRSALDLWRTSAPDLLCLDIMMPGIDGYDGCRRVRGSDRKIPILFLSSKNREIDVVAGLDLSADDFIRKPFTRGEAVSRDAFLDACWGVDWFPDSRTLDQHIFLLRRKIEADPGNPKLIQSVRGVGYRYG